MTPDTTPVGEQQRKEARVGLFNFLAQFEKRNPDMATEAIKNYRSGMQRVIRAYGFTHANDTRLKTGEVPKLNLLGQLQETGGPLLVSRVLIAGLSDFLKREGKATFEPHMEDWAETLVKLGAKGKRDPVVEGSEMLSKFIGFLTANAKDQTQAAEQREKAMTELESLGKLVGNGLEVGLEHEEILDLLVGYSPKYAAKHPSKLRNEIFN